MKKLVVVMLIVLGVGGLTAGVSAPYEYSSGTTNLLSRLVFDASGANVQAHRAWLNERLMLPLALRDFVFEPDPSGILVGSSYLYASARDWARIGQLMLNGGQLNGYRLVSEFGYSARERQIIRTT